MQIAKSTLYDWINNCSYLLNDTKSNILTKRCAIIVRSARIVTSDIQSFIVDYVIKHPTFNMKKLSKKLSVKYSITISKSYIYRILAKNNMTHKKVQKNTYPHKISKFKKEVKQLKKYVDDCNNDFTAIDETAVYLGTSNNHGWSNKGKRCIVKSTFNRSNRYSMCEAISKDKVISHELIKGTYNTNKFNNFVIDKVMPNMTNNTILMDGAVIHKSKELANKLNSLNIKKIINVPYSPQFNPIEFTFNTLKSKIKINNVTTKKQLDKLLDKHIKESDKNGHKKYYDHTYKNIKNVIS
jgi:putative transposase